MTGSPVGGAFWLGLWCESGDGFELHLGAVADLIDDPVAAGLVQPAAGRLRRLAVGA